VNEKTIERRKRIAEETFTTEQSYVSSLGVVMEVSLPQVPCHSSPELPICVHTCELLDNYSELDSCSWWSRWGINGVADEGSVETKDVIWNMVLCPKLKFHL